MLPHPILAIHSTVPSALASTHQMLLPPPLLCAYLALCPDLPTAVTCPLPSLHPAFPALRLVMPSAMSCPPQSSCPATPCFLFSKAL